MKFKALSCCIALLLLAGAAHGQWSYEYQADLGTAFYAVEFFAPHLSTYVLHSNEDDDNLDGEEELAQG